MLPHGREQLFTSFLVFLLQKKCLCNERQPRPKSLQQGFKAVPLLFLRLTGVETL